jgi:hypothetical protein
MPIEMENKVKYNPIEMDKNLVNIWANRLENNGQHDNRTKMDN